MSSSSKRRREEEEQEIADNLLGEELNDLYAANQISAKKANSLLTKSSKAGLNFRHAFKNKVTKKDGVHNAARTLLRWMKKQSAWGKLYWCKIPLWDKKKKASRLSWHPFLLPHEWLGTYLACKGSIDEGQPRIGTFQYKQLAKAAKEWGDFHAFEFFPLGLHGDGVPIQGRMNQDTLDFITINMPCSPLHSQIRIPVTCIEKKFNAGVQTVKSIFQVLSWSLSSLGKGYNPERRHDGRHWLKSLDKARAGQAGMPLPFKAALIQIRADWDWYQHWMGAAPWNQNSGMCWMCRAKPNEWRSMGPKEREENSLSKAEFLESVQTRDKLICPLFNLPGISNHIMHPDWMHSMDEGFSQLVAGQILFELLPHYPGRNQGARVASMWEHIQSLYKAEGTPWEQRLPKLTLKDIHKPKNTPSLDCKAVRCRYFCKFLQKLTASKNFASKSLHCQAVHSLAKQIGLVYHHLEIFNADELAKAMEKAVKQYLALEQETLLLNPEETKLWHCLPKAHLCGHISDLVKQGANPKDSWNYRDETFAHAIQKMSFRRGGKAKPTADTVLTRWMARQPWPSLDKASKVV